MYERGHRPECLASQIEPTCPARDFRAARGYFAAAFRELAIQSDTIAKLCNLRSRFLPGWRLRTRCSNDAYDVLRMDNLPLHGQLRIYADQSDTGRVATLLPGYACNRPYSERQFEQQSGAKKKK
eukprot:scaffold133195_cov17-Prasinocladus_malaysianus.AAC.1